MTDAPVEVRAADDADRGAIMGVASRALGWVGDERDRAFFAWKHDENPFGRSPAWVAVLDGEVVGFRTFVRWELERDGARLRLARAVDTATDPAAQGKGIFRRLTLDAVDALTEQGYDAIFNTPNDQSRPGYLKMGWSQLGRPALGVVPRSPLALTRMIRSRLPAERWSVDTAVGDPAAEVLATLTDVPATRARPGWATERTLPYLRWRYSFEPLHYRAIEVRGGLCLFRVRRRGPSLEVALVEWLSDERDARAVHRLVRAAGDYAVGIGLGLRPHGALPIPSQGPIITWRPLRDPEVPDLDALSLGLGDLELF